MIVVFENRVTSFRTFIVRLFSGDKVHCYIGLKEGNRWLVYDFENDVLIKTYKRDCELWGKRVYIKAPPNIRTILDSYLGKRYDWKAIISLALRIDWEDEERIICSEFVLKVLKEIGVYKGETLLSPNKAYKALDGRVQHSSDITGINDIKHGMAR